MNRVAVAIDGPSGAGKSTISRVIAERMGFTYVDTGAIYRTVGLYMKESGVAISDTARVAEKLGEVGIEIYHGEGGQQMLLNGRDVSADIRVHAISEWASAVSAIPAVRAYLLEMQRAFAKTHSVIMDGRDIGTVVLPDAQIKIFLTASPEDRANRRYLELIERGEKVTPEGVLADVLSRDARDSSREVAPLRPAEDAIVVDTTGNTLDESIEQICAIVKERMQSCGFTKQQ